MKVVLIEEVEVERRGEVEGLLVLQAGEVVVEGPVHGPGAGWAGTVLHCSREREKL